MTPAEIVDIKRSIIRALVSDDEIMASIVLKGGSAIEMFYNQRQTARFSGDLDFSLKEDFDDLTELRDKIQKLLLNEFKDSPLKPIDITLTDVTSKLNVTPIKGYVLELKLITEDNLKKAGENPQRQSKMTENMYHGKKFEVEFSGDEYSEGYQYQDIEGLTVQVYTPDMIVCEKLRAICQQMPEHKETNQIRSPGRGRARDFYDIYYLMENFEISLVSNDCMHILKEMFSIKNVDLSYLKLISNYFEMHLADEPSLKSTAPHSDLKPFKFYFDYVVNLISGLDL